jgi:hypothetical protein
MMPIEKKIWYVVMNNGDGSVSVEFFETQELAELFELFQLALYGEGWGDCVALLDVKATSDLRKLTSVSYITLTAATVSSIEFKSDTTIISKDVHGIEYFKEELKECRRYDKCKGESWEKFFEAFKRLM